MSDFMGNRHAVSAISTACPFINALFNFDVSRMHVCFCMHTFGELIIPNNFIAEVIKHFCENIKQFDHRHTQFIFQAEIFAECIRKRAQPYTGP